MKKTLIFALLLSMTVGCNFIPKNNPETAEPETIADTIDIDHDRLITELLELDSSAQDKKLLIAEMIEEEDVDRAAFYNWGEQKFSTEDLVEIEKESKATWNYFIDLCKQRQYKQALDYYVEHTDLFRLHFGDTFYHFMFHLQFVEELADNVYPYEQASEILANDMEFIMLTCELELAFNAEYSTISDFYLDMLNKTKRYYARQKNFDKVLELIYRTRKWVETSYGKDSYSYALTFEEEGTTFIMKKDLKKSLVILQEAERIYQKLADNDSCQYKQEAQCKLEQIQSLIESVQARIEMGK